MHYSPFIYQRPEMNFTKSALKEISKACRFSHTFSSSTSSDDPNLTHVASHLSLSVMRRISSQFISNASGCHLSLSVMRREQTRAESSHFKIKLSGKYLICFQRK